MYIRFLYDIQSFSCAQIGLVIPGDEVGSVLRMEIIERFDQSFQMPIHPIEEIPNDKNSSRMD